MENEPVKAHELLAKADALEDEDAAPSETTSSSIVDLLKTNIAASRELDALDSRNATLIIEGAGQAAGVIVSTNAAGS